MEATGRLTQRKAAVLRALVRQYIRTGEPVGSEAVASSSGLGVSSATVRNELSALEELGFLTQPHTSAGRIPTDLAYRYYVNLLPERSRLRDAERLAIVHFFDEALADVDEILRGTTQLLSRMTRHMSLALAPSPREAALARTELLRIGSSVLLLVVFDNGRIEKRLLDVPKAVSDDDLEELTRVLTEATRGRTLADARVAIASASPPAHVPGSVAVLHRAAAALDSLDEAVGAAHVFLSGVANMAAEEAFIRRESLRRVYEALERESDMLRLLRDAAAEGRVSVTIGRENQLSDMWETSVIVAPYAAAGGPVGTIAVIGPTRMDYAGAISAVQAVAERLSAAVQALSG